MERTFPESDFKEEIDPDKVYYESRNFLNESVPFSLKTDVMTASSNHYLHKHREIEILMGISGQGTVVLGPSSIPFGVGEIVIINPNVVHYISSESVVKYYYIIIDTDFLLKNGIDVEAGYFDERITDTKLVQLISKLSNEYSVEDQYKNVMLRSCIIEIMVEICRRHQRTDVVSSNESKTILKIKHTVNYIKNNFRNDISLDDIASEAGLSKYHFCREFKRATDLTPIEFINRTRCEYAKGLLVSKKYSVSEIGEICGFSTTAHFSRTFKKFFGTYPSEFIKKNKNT